MTFWMAILAGILFAWLAVRAGFYETWALLFNVVVSIYIAIFLAPLAAALTPASAYGMAFTMLVLAGGCFAILHGLCYVFLTGQFSVRFPRFFDILLAGALGFAAGFLIMSFVALVITVTPLAEHGLVGSLALDPKSPGPNVSGLAWCCNRVHAVAGFDSSEEATPGAIERLLARSQQMTSAARSEPGEPNVPSVTPREPSLRPGRARDPVDDIERL